MTTAYLYQIAFIAPAAHVDACNRAANALGRSGDNFSVPLSSNGAEPATHFGGSAREMGGFVQAVGLAASGIPPAEGLDPDDWQVVANHLDVVADPAETTDALQQFEQMLAKRGLMRVGSGVNRPIV
ncbi:hypothetical protein [Epibacterium ulvae]|uniref:hypothetical protein n=1 Tax=Epibacterium ulvae TaxID=1156985 RepID=UPI002493059E|nr:hypothetical protein [Epibacterium ulvae]